MRMMIEEEIKKVMKIDLRILIKNLRILKIDLLIKKDKIIKIDLKILIKNLRIIKIDLEDREKIMKMKIGPQIGLVRNVDTKKISQIDINVFNVTQKNLWIIITKDRIFKIKNLILKRDKINNL